ncbi:MAG: NADP-dependent oxidoreductase [Myxococcota bacterium]|nr:NADP-dependent oxidoreductase [Myxococcota bacterium]
MARPINRMWRLGRQPEGEPVDDDVAWAEEPTAEPGDGEVVVRVGQVLVDSLLRTTGLPPVAVGEVMRGAASGVVLESRDPAVPVGARVSGLLGWQTHARVAGSQVFVHDPARPFTDDDYLGVLNYLGATAYFAVRDVLQVTAADTLVITAGAGAVGSLAGQLAKQEGARVVGIATTPERCRWMTEELGFDVAIDRRAEDLGPALARSCPDGLTACLDGSGGAVLDACLGRLAMHARIALFGTAQATRAPGPAQFPAVVTKRARLQGFSFLDYPLRLEEALAELGAKRAAGTLKYRLETLPGLEHAPAAMRRVKGEDETIVLRVGAPLAHRARASGA